MTMFQRQDFHFDLPDELIAQVPLAERSASRLLCLEGGSGSLVHRQFRELVDLVADRDLLVFNNTKVLPARLYGCKQTGGRVEILIERLRGDGKARSNLRMMFSTSSPTYPASVNVVASAIVKGTSKIRANVCANRVLPHPVGPISKILDFESSISPPLSAWLRRL